jgi:hypothetical protein
MAVAVTKIQHRRSNNDGLYIQLEFKEFDGDLSKKSLFEDHVYLSSDELKDSTKGLVLVHTCNMVELPKKYVVVELDEYEQELFCEKKDAIQTAVY